MAKVEDSYPCPLDAVTGLDQPFHSTYGVGLAEVIGGWHHGDRRLFDGFDLDLCTGRPARRLDVAAEHLVCCRVVKLYIRTVLIKSKGNAFTILGLDPIWVWLPAVFGWHRLGVLTHDAPVTVAGGDGRRGNGFWQGRGSHWHLLDCHFLRWCSRRSSHRQLPTAMPWMTLALVWPKLGIGLMMRQPTGYGTSGYEVPNMLRVSQCPRDGGLMRRGWKFVAAANGWGSKLGIVHGNGR